jgi:SAM-dependent methyltransferase
MMDRTATAPVSNPWDDYADELDHWYSTREGGQVVDTTFPDRLLDLLGDLDGQAVLDACCGQGYYSRKLAARGARVTGIDLSPRLIAKARAHDPEGAIDYRLGDLSRPIPELEGRFDVIASYLAFNNPYSSVVREHVLDYFAEGAMGTYHGLWQQGIRARYYHRTLEQYLDAFLDAGLRLVKLVDVPDGFIPHNALPPGSRFPRFMILAFERP